MQFAAQRAFIQRLNIFQPMFETVTAQVDLVFRHGVKHERVVGIGGMTQGEGAVVHPHTLALRLDTVSTTNAVCVREAEPITCLAWQSRLSAKVSAL